MVPVAVASCDGGGDAAGCCWGPGPSFRCSRRCVPMQHMAMHWRADCGLVAGVVCRRAESPALWSEDCLRGFRFTGCGGRRLVVSSSGLAGLIFPPALGVGYGVIQRLVNGDMTWKLILGVLLVKSFIWTFSLGSNTSGGILAPLLMIGGAMGAAMGHVLTPVSHGGVGAGGDVVGACGGDWGSADGGDACGGVDA